MTVRIAPPPAEQPPALHHRAMDNLRYIRETMERASAFTAVPGWGPGAIGLTPLGPAYFGARQPKRQTWPGAGLGEGGLSALFSRWAGGRKAGATPAPPH